MISKFAQRQFVLVEVVDFQTKRDIIHSINVIKREHLNEIIKNAWEVAHMATKSILKNINIKDKRLARTFVEALSGAENTK